VQLNLYKRARFFAVSYFFILVFFLSAFENKLDHQGNPIGSDFVHFWSAGYIANHGLPENSYQADQIFKASKIAVPENSKQYLWLYPPTFLLVVQAFAKLAYLPALLVWSLVGLFGYLFVIYKIFPGRATFWVSAGFWPVLINLLQGQNGFLSTILLAGAYCNLISRPIIAGILIGLLAYKPQLGLIVPLALLAGRQYVVFISAVITVIGMNLTAFLYYGLASYQAFFLNLEISHAFTDQGVLSLFKMPSFFAALRILDVDSNIALSIHAFFGSVIAVLTACVWRKNIGMDIKMSVLIFGSMVVPHYLNDYDLLLLIIPIILQLKRVEAGNALGNEKIFLSLIWLSPLFMTLTYGLGKAGHKTPFVLLSPFLILTFFIYSVRVSYLVSHKFLKE
jgi:alpha-1,2-mannosyltransferase